jgi:predicted N-acetyltransferase YhbS
VGEALMRAVLTALAERKVRRIVLHASDDGRPLYERLGFVPTNEMRLEPPPDAREAPAWRGRPPRSPR